MKNTHLVIVVIVIVVILYLSRGKIMAGVSSLTATQLTKNFTLEELTKTSKPYPNVPSSVQIKNLTDLAVYILQPIRDYVKKAVIVNSAFRSPEVNKAVGGATTSQHLEGKAADIVIPGYSNQDIIDIIYRLGLPFDQVIDEKLQGAEWVHVSYNGSKGRKQWLTARDGATQPIYTTIKSGIV